jgi:hypothetical protein
MAKEQRPRQSRLGKLPGQTSKVPLIYYRSGKPAGSSRSPFKKAAPSTKSKARKLFTRFLDVVIVLAIVVGLGYSLLVGSKPDILVNSDAYHPKTTYREAIVKELQNIKNHNKITLDEQSIVKSLQSQFPEIASVQITLPIFSQTPTFRINIASPGFVLSSNGQSYIINSQGVAVASSSNFPSIKNLPVVTDQSGFTIEKGKQVLSGSEVSFINTLIVQCRKANVPIQALTLPPLAQELDLRTSDKPYYVKFYLGGDSKLQAGQFLATRHEFDSTNTQPSEYLDVRVSGKVFYK